MKINVRGPMNCFLGYGHCCFNIVKALTQLGHEIAYFPIGQIQLTTGHQDEELILKCINNQGSFDYNAPSLTIWHENNLAERIGRGPHITLSFYEMNKLDDRRIHHLSSSDHIISPSSWWTEVLKDQLTCPNLDDFITTISMGVDTKVFKPIENPETNFDRPVQFLNIGKIEIRKGHDIICRAFKQAFPLDEEYELTLMWTNPFLNDNEIKEWNQMYRNMLGEKVKWIPYLKTDKDLAGVINNADCCIFPTRAEGFGMPILQSLACGKKVITTNYSAHTEFCNNDNCNLILIDELESAYDGQWFHNQGDWAILGDKQIDLFSDYLRDIYESHKNKKSLYNKAGVETAKEYHWSRTADAIASTLEKINEKFETTKV